MSKRPGRGLFVLSVDVRDDQDKRTQTQIDHIMKTLQQCQIPATWALASPGTSPVAARLVQEPLSHEVAILGEPNWVGEQAGRTRFARELASRVAAATANGLRPKTLALVEAELEEHLDLLVKHRICLVRSATTMGFQPQSLRFGVWQAPISFMVPSGSRWPFAATEWAIGRALTRASKSQDVVHVVADLNSSWQHSGAASLDRVLAVVRRRQSKGLVAPITLANVADRLAPRNRLPAARSVLRAA